MSIRMKLAHVVSGHGKGTWHSNETLWAYKLRRRKARKVASASRARNRR